MLSDVEFHLLIIMTCGTIYLNMHFVNEDNLSDLFKFTQQENARAGIKKLLTVTVMQSSNNNKMSV